MTTGAVVASSSAYRTRPSEFRGMADSEVVADFLQGNSRAFDELVRRYEGPLQFFVYKACGDRERSEDLVQETFLRVHRHLHNFDQTKKFSTWIYTIASNLTKNELRNRNKSPIFLFQMLQRNWRDDSQPLQFEDPGSRPDDLYRKRHLRKVVDEAVQKLTFHHRVAFTLREIEGKSYEEIAEITKANIGTVKSRLNRARDAFAELVAPSLD